MGYFKKRRIAKKQKDMQTFIDLFTAQTIGVHKAVNEGVTEAINIFDASRHEFEKNARSNLKLCMLGDSTREVLIADVASMIEGGMELYGYRIAKAKREQLAVDILNELADEKKNR